MPVDPTGLRDDLLALFSAPPATVALCAADWAAAVGGYATAVVPPSTTVAAAQATLEGAITSALGSAFPASATALDAAFQAFGVTVGGGMPPVPSPPPPPASPPGWQAQLAISQSSHGDGADAFRDMINTWFTSSGWA